MIYDKIKDKREKEKQQEKQEKQKKLNEIKKRMEKTTIVKNLKTVFSIPYIEKIEVLKSEIEKYKWTITPSYNTTITIRSLNEFYETLINEKSNYSRERERDLKNNIEEKVLLSMLNASDLQWLIEAISKEFMK